MEPAERLADRAHLVVLHDGTDSRVLDDVLAARRRPVRAVARHRGERPPSDPEEIRALIALGHADGEDVGLMSACVEAQVPVLALGGAAAALSAVLGLSLEAGGDPERITVAEVRSLPGSEDDPVFGGVPEGSAWLVSSAPRPTGETGDGAPLAVDGDGRPVAVRGGAAAYAVWLRPDLDPAEHGVLPPEGGERLVRFMRAPAAALLGRFVDRVVGRTDAEAPWGRRGPGPKSAPGLYFNPA